MTTEYKIGMMDSRQEAIDQGALRAWEAYRQAIGGKAFNGDPLPDWATMENDQSKAGIVKAWKAVSERLGSYWTDQYLCTQDAGLREGERKGTK